MYPQLFRTFLVLAFITAFSPTSTSAQTFSVNLGGRTIGTLTYTRESNVETMQTTMNNTPMGVFNGSYKGTSSPVRTNENKTVHQYFGDKNSSRKNRQTSILKDKNKVIKTTISPLSDRTELSEAKRVPTPVVDPVAAFGRFFATSGCPRRFQIYDGRRVISLTPTSEEQKDSILVCEMDYLVTDGPGHLSPLYIKSASTRLAYDLSNGRQKLTSLRFSSGLFKVILTRQN